MSRYAPEMGASAVCVCWERVAIWCVGNGVRGRARGKGVRLSLRRLVVAVSGLISGAAFLAAGGSAVSPDFASTGSEGAFAPTANTVLAGGVHNFTTIDIPAGVTVTIAAGSNNGVLDLRATGDVSIDGTIDLSGAPGGQGPAHDVLWTGSGGGDTANPLARAFTPVPGSGCDASGHPGLGGAGFAGADGSRYCGAFGAGGVWRRWWWWRRRWWRRLWRWRRRRVR